MQLRNVNVGPSLDPGRARCISLPEGVAGVRATLSIMADLARQYKSDPVIRHLATRLTQHLKQKDWIGEITALHSYVRDYIRYVKDTHGVELVQSPDRTIGVKSGDCDDKATLLATLLEAIGHPAQFMAIGQTPGKYDHVLVRTRVGPRWITLETTEPVRVGWQPRFSGKPIIVNI